MRQSIHEVIERAREILAENNVRSVAIAVYKKYSAKQLTNLYWTEAFSKIHPKQLGRVSGFLILETDGIGFETIGSTSEQEAKAIIDGWTAASDLQSIKMAVFG